MIGRILSFETREKIRIANSGEKSVKWKGGITPLNKQIRDSDKYFNWRASIFKRDNFICCECKDVSKKYLNAHHIKRFNKILKENNIKTLEDALSCSELWNITN